MLPQPQRHRSTDRIKFPNTSADAPTVKKRIDKADKTDKELPKPLRGKSRSFDALRFRNKKGQPKSKSKSRSKDRMFKQA